MLHKNTLIIMQIFSNTYVEFSLSVLDKKYSITCTVPIVFQLSLMIIYSAHLQRQKKV